MDAALREELMAEVDDVWSGNIRHLPLAAGVADATREPSEITAVLRTGDRTKQDVEFDRGRRLKADIAAEGGFLRVDRAVFPDLVLKKNDKVVALDRPGQPVFEILHVDDRSHLRLICELGDAN